MVTERGPHGTIAVVTIEPDKEVVSHALTALRNRSLPHLLPMNARELFGRNQLCADITGLISLADPQVGDVYASSYKRKKACADLFISVGDLLDRMMSPAGLLLNPENVWIDPQSGELFFTYIPLRSGDSESHCMLSSIDSDSLEKLLLHDFFSEVITDDIRNRIIDCVNRDDELGYCDAVEIIRTADDKEPRRQKLLTPLAIAWGSILLLIIFFLPVLFGLSGGVTGRLGMYKCGAAFVAGSILLTFSAYIAFHHKDNPSGSERPADEKSGINLLFPESADRDLQKIGSDSPFPEPAFLVEQCEYGKKISKRKRCVIWTDDLLIGSDQLLCDFSVSHASVSPRHARIVRREGLFFLIDLGSRSGSYIGHRKLFSHEENPLSDGDTVRIGDIRFLFSYRDQNENAEWESDHSDVVSPSSFRKVLF